MKANSRLLLVVALWLGAAPALLAAPLATTITYQGKLNDGDTPASGSYDFRFVLLDAVVGGGRLGDPLIVENLTVLGGVFTTGLDFGAVFDGTPRWLEIAVRPGASAGEFTALTPRQPLTGAPYALYALTPAGPQGVQGLKGDPGAAGAAGAAGPKGDPGAAGLKGEKGDIGLTGVAGPPGAAGIKGDKGDPGLTGPQGLVGSTGSAGAAGPKGDTGAAGTVGPKGDKGETGSTGPAGPQGSTGVKGDTGLTGPGGAAGPQGIQGVAGALGPVGPQGPIGLTGATGNTGATGPAGSTGATGATGPAGAKGVNWRGPWSTATAYALNDAVALNGSSWQAKVANTASAPFEGSVNWDLLAKKGDPGATGLQGPAGATGATGSQGPIGLTGGTGATGPGGAAGPPGPVGPQGPSGAFTPVGPNASFVGGNVGIGTATPQAKLHVEGGDLLAGAPGKEWIFHTRYQAGGDFLHITDSDNGAYHFEHGLTLNKAGNVGIGLTSGTNKLEVAGNTRIDGSLGINGLYDYFSLLIQARPSQSHPLFIRDSTAAHIFSIAILNPGQASLSLAGNAFKSEGGTSWVAPSDRRLKQDVRQFEPGLNEILQLQPVRFRYRDGIKEGLTSAQEEVGFIAQEVREVIPDAVTEGADGYLSLKADPIHWAAINAIRELNAKIETQRGENTELRREVQELGQLVNSLASRLDASAH